MVGESVGVQVGEGLGVPGTGVVPSDGPAEPGAGGPLTTGSGVQPGSGVSDDFGPTLTPEVGRVVGWSEGLPVAPVVGSADGVSLTDG